MYIHIYFKSFKSRKLYSLLENQKKKKIYFLLLLCNSKKKKEKKLYLGDFPISATNPMTPINRKMKKVVKCAATSNIMFFECYLCFYK